MRSQNKLRRRVAELVKSQGLPAEVVEPGKELQVRELGQIWVESGGKSALLVAKPTGRAAESFRFDPGDEWDLPRAVSKAVAALTTPKG